MYTNKLVRFYNGVDGLKTGYTEEAGYCLTATIKKDNMRLIAVAMGEPTSGIRNSEISNLLDYGYNMFENSIYVTKDKILDKVKVQQGIDEYVNIVATEDVLSVNKKGYKMGKITYDLNLNELKAPISKGQIVGTLDIKEDNKVLNTINVTVDKTIKKAGLFTMYLRNIKNMLGINI